MSVSDYQVILLVSAARFICSCAFLFMTRGNKNTRLDLTSLVCYTYLISDCPGGSDFNELFYLQNAKNK